MNKFMILQKFWITKEKFRSLLVMEGKSAYFAKHYAAVPTTAVLPVPPIQPQIPSPNGVQTLFVPGPVAPAIPFSAPVPIPPGSTAWPATPPPHQHVPGTGVFLPPPGSDNASNQLLPTTATELNIPVDTTSPPEKEDVTRKHELVSF
ncbi:hypothetical protein V6N11_083480 [Hibiscus sabdariffa]|uniref:Uncharacterized protein n=1 Tax=Hibiscus sabdariffa TaxID=183260 RepID=A0ABR2QM08_9ROSI